MKLRAFSRAGLSFGCRNAGTESKHVRMYNAPRTIPTAITQLPALHRSRLTLEVDLLEDHAQDEMVWGHEHHAGDDAQHAGSEETEVEERPDEDEAAHPAGGVHAVFLITSSLSKVSRIE